MTLYKPSDLRAFLENENAFPKKSLSQNFLIDGNIIKKILKTANIQPNDWVLEIGPGPGALTQALLQAQANVIAIEKDRVFAEKLQRLKGNLEIFCEDVLKSDLEKIIAGKKVKVVANLPYSITTPLLTKICKMHSCISSLTVMVQEEVARRMTAASGSKEYSSLTIFLHFYAEVTYGFKVSHHCFYPKPKVDSAIVELTLQPPRLQDETKFFQIVRTAFNQRRKTLRATLKSLYPPMAITNALEELGLSPEARPEELSIQSFLRLEEILKPS